MATADLPARLPQRGTHAHYEFESKRQCLVSLRLASRPDMRPFIVQVAPASRLSLRPATACASATDLPPELLALVFASLSSRERTSVAALVCRTWAAVALDPTLNPEFGTIWLRLPERWHDSDDLEQGEYLTALERLVRVRHRGATRTLHVTRWELRGDGEQEVQVFSGLLSLFAKIERLYLYKCFKAYKKQDRVLQLVSCYCPALKYLQWSVLLYDPKNLPRGAVLPTVKEVRTSQLLSPCVAGETTLRELLEVFPGLALLKS